MKQRLTSESAPIRVDFLPQDLLGLRGRLGMTFAPGKKQPAAATGSWDRDLGADITRLRAEFATDHLVCLIEDHEFAELGIERLPQEAAAAGIAFHRLPIADFSTPPDPASAAALVSDIAGWAAAGENVVVHCKGGLGRAGTIGGCVLRYSGMDGEHALQALVETRGPGCPESDAQRQFVRDFAPGAPSPRSRVGRRRASTTSSSPASARRSASCSPSWSSTSPCPSSASRARPTSRSIGRGGS